MQMKNKNAVEDF